MIEASMAVMIVAVIGLVLRLYAEVPGRDPRRVKNIDEFAALPADNLIDHMDYLHAPHSVSHLVRRERNEDPLFTLTRAMTMGAHRQWHMPMRMFGIAEAVRLARILNEPAPPLSLPRLGRVARERRTRPEAAD